MWFELYCLTKSGISQTKTHKNLSSCLEDILKIDKTIEDYQSYRLIQKFDGSDRMTDIVSWQSRDLAAAA